MSRIFLTALILVLILLVGIGFTALNAGSVTIDYFLGTVTTTLPWALLATLAVGFLLGLLVMGLLTLKSRRESRRLRRDLRGMEAELKNLRNAPIRNG
ncbi:MAG: lipopolysaccharide assembly protein LapA domain-containing protein [Gammaproteobacteria bacterium]|nr:lipopolysaccharide assembly protein LapA domain-containing protein [Gammaproteobacteria bacterium]